MSDEKKSSDAVVASATAATGSNAKNKPTEVQLTPQQQTIRLLRSHIFMIRKGVVQSDGRLLTRVLRQMTGVRTKLTFPVMKAFTRQYAPNLTQQIIDAQGSKMSDADTTAEEEDLAPPSAPTTTTTTPATPATASSSTTPATVSDGGAAAAAAAAAAKRQADLEESQRKEQELLQANVPEVDIYTQLLIAYFFYDQGLKEEAATRITQLFQQLSQFNRRTLDAFSAKIYSFYSLVYETLGKDVEIRNSLLLAHRTACLQHNEPGQAALSVCILRNYLNHHLYTLADTFRLKSTFPDQRSNAQTARYSYYIGKILAVQLHYSDAYASLTQALRKAPQKAAVGFRQICTKLLILVQLLMGDIPERSLFSPKDLKKSLAPYLSLTQAVRVGDLSKFNEAMNKHKLIFERDGIYSLIIRLRSNVIKAGLRKINLAYSKISIKDICSKLKLDSVEDGEYMVAKAIHDGVIEASVDRESSEVFSREVIDVYATNEPQQTYHKRIQFTLDIHQQAVKSLRYPATSTNKTKNDWESDDEEDEDTIAGNAPDKREEEKKKDS